MRIINVGKLLIIIVLLIIILYFYYCVYPLFDIKGDLEEYLMDNFIEINENQQNDYSKILSLDDNVNVILLGEEHGVALNEFIELDLLQYLIIEKGVMNYIGEFPLSYGLILNEYIKTGNEELLKNLFLDSKETYFYTNENYNKWKHLYHFLKQENLNSAFNIIGVDMENNMEVTFEQIDKILMNCKEDTFVGMLKLLGSFKEEFKRVVAGASKDLSKLNNLKEEIYSAVQITQIQDKDKSNLMHIVVNLNNYCVFQKTNGINKKNEYRDSIMYDNFAALRDEDPTNLFFGKMGANHVLQKEFRNKIWFANYFQENDKVVSLLIRYKNSRRMSKDKPHSNKHFTKIDDPLRLMSKYQENKIYLFNLDKEKSPFNENLLFLKSDPKDRTTDYFQYMYIINRGRKAEHLKM